MLDTLVEKTRLGSIYDLPITFGNQDLLLTQYVYLYAMCNCIKLSRTSRGSYIICDNNGILPLKQLPEKFRFRMDTQGFEDKVQEIMYVDGECKINWRPVRPIPRQEQWFDSVWNAFMGDEIIHE